MIGQFKSQSAILDAAIPALKGFAARALRRVFVVAAAQIRRRAAKLLRLVRAKSKALKMLCDFIFGNYGGNFVTDAKI